MYVIVCFKDEEIKRVDGVYVNEADAKSVAAVYRHETAGSYTDIEVHEIIPSKMGGAVHA